MHRKKIVSWGILVAWMVFIFVMSNTPGNESKEQSELVVYLLSWIRIDLKSAFGELATLIIRKGAHFTEYFILFILLYRVSILYNDIKYRKICLVGIVFLYSCSDEIHQYFIPGRAARFTDVMIDTLGGLFACIVIIIIRKYKNNRRIS